MDFKNINQKSGGALIYKTVLKLPDFVREQGAICFENGAYTTVREYFKADCNAASGQKMVIYKQFLG